MVSLELTHILAPSSSGLSLHRDRLGLCWDFRNRDIWEEEGSQAGGRSVLTRSWGAKGRNSSQKGL